MSVPNNRISILYDENFYYKRALNFNCSQCMLQHNFMQLYNITLLVNAFISDREASPPPEKIFSFEELAAFDGSSGRPAYTAVNGVIYDVSNAPSWGGGTHFGIYAGKDVSSDFKNCHNTSIALSKLPKVGKLEMK